MIDDTYIERTYSIINGYMVGQDRIRKLERRANIEVRNQEYRERLAKMDLDKVPGISRSKALKDLIDEREVLINERDKLLKGVFDGSIDKPFSSMSIEDCFESIMVDIGKIYKVHTIKKGSRGLILWHLAFISENLSFFMNTYNNDKDVDEFLKEFVQTVKRRLFKKD